MVFYGSLAIPWIMSSNMTVFMSVNRHQIHLKTSSYKL